jgi:hypothetical protein
MVRHAAGRTPAEFPRPSGARQVRRSATIIARMTTPATATSAAIRALEREFLAVTSTPA